MRRALKKVFFSIVLAALSLLLVEALMFLLEPWMSRGFYQYDPDLGFRVRPGAQGSNRFGFNDRDYDLRKELGTYRIVVVNDSFGWAGGLDQNYTARLEKKLEDHFGGHRVDVINTGYPMSHTGEQLGMLKKFALQYQPDLVVLGFFAGNDFFDADLRRKRIVVNDTYLDIDPRDETVFLGRPLVGQSRLLSFVRQKTKAWRELRAVRREHGSTNSMAVATRDTYLAGARLKLEMFDRGRKSDALFKSRVKSALGYVSQMDDLLKARGIAFVVAVFPDEFQVSPALFGDICAKFKCEPAQFDLEQLQDILGRHLASRGIPSIDMLDAFRNEEGVRGDLYIPNDSHWNEAGCELAANILFTNVVQRADEALKH